MKQLFVAILLAGLLVPGLAAGEGAVKVLRIEIPAGAKPGDGTLLIDLEQLTALGTELASYIPDADIALLDPQDGPLANLGRVKKGKIKWGHKTQGGRALAVSFGPAACAVLSESILARAPRPGFKLAVYEEATGVVLGSVPVTFSDFADLAVRMNYPINVVPGQSLGGDVTVTLENAGTCAARDVVVEIVLSGDDRIPRASAVESAAFAEDALLAGGRETVPVLEPGQRLTLTFEGRLKLPDDTPPGKNYLAAVADPGDRIPELSEENNVHCGFIINAVPEPSAFTLEMPETLLHFEPATYGFKISCAGVLLSDGKDWKLCRMKPSVYQIKHVSWSDCFWEIDTVGRRVFEITGATFCKRGGQDRGLGIKVEVSGGSLDVPPSRFTLKLAQTELRFEPGTRKFALTAHGRPIFHLPFWWACKLKSFLYHIRFALWENYFWQVDTHAREISGVTDGKFCSPGGIASKISLPVKVED